MNHVLLGELTEKEVITAGYDREEVIATITTNITSRELNILELALFRHWLGQVDIDGNAVNCDQLNADAAYYMWKKVRFWNKEIKSSIEKSK